MTTQPTTQLRQLAQDDPRRLRALLERSQKLAHEHGLPSVVVGLAGREGDLLLPELLRFIESALRVEDAIFHLTRERAVLFLADVDEGQAAGIVDRFVAGFRERFASAGPPALDRGFQVVRPGGPELPLKDVLPTVFPSIE